MFHYLAKNKIRRKFFFRKKFLRSKYFFNFRTLSITKKTEKVLFNKQNSKFYLCNIRKKKFLRRKRSFKKIRRYHKYFFFFSNFILYKLNFYTRYGRKLSSKKFKYFYKRCRRQYFYKLRRGLIKRIKVKFYVPFFFRRLYLLNYKFLSFKKIYVKLRFKK